MKGKRFLLVILVFALSVSLLGCGEMSDAEVQLRYGLRMFFNRFNFFQPTSFYGFSGDNLDDLEWGAEQLRAGMEENTALLQKYPNAYGVPSAAGSDPDCTEIPVRGSRDGKAYLWQTSPPRGRPCLYDVTPAVSVPVCLDRK